MSYFYGFDITLNDKKEFRSLIELIYLGNHVINSYRSNSTILWKYEQLVNKVFSFSDPIGFKDINYDEIENTYTLKPNLESHIEKRINDYDNNVFWDLLVKRLVNRDMTNKYGNITTMNRQQLKEMKDLEKHYTKEIKEHGINNFELKIENNRYFDEGSNI